MALKQLVFKKIMAQKFTLDCPTLGHSKCKKNYLLEPLLLNE